MDVFENLPFGVDGKCPLKKVSVRGGNLYGTEKGRGFLGCAKNQSEIH